MSWRTGRDYLPDFGLLVIRLMLGSVFIFHGAQKLFGIWDGAGLGGFATWLETINMPYPPYAAVLAGGAEFLGGVALVSGIWMRTATLPLIATMAVAITFVHAHTMSAQENGIEYPLTLAVVLLGLACTGPGRFWFNLDALPKRSGKSRSLKSDRAASDRVELGSYTPSPINPLPEPHEPLNRTA